MNYSLLIKEISDRGITRLCHFTRATKALNIMDSEDGIIAVDFLEADIYYANDEERYDGRLSYVNCSIQFPNHWYLNRVKDKDPLFKEWVILLINPNVLLLESTEYCITNAATGRGSYIKKGQDAFSEMFNDVVSAKYTRYRTTSMLKCCPTDGQAEVLVYKNISRKDIIGIAVIDEDQAEKMYFRLYRNLTGIPQVDIIIAPDMFSGEWNIKARSGIIPYEYSFFGGE